MADKKLTFDSGSANLVYQAAPVADTGFDFTNAVDIDPQTMRPFDPEIPTEMARQKSAEAQRQYNLANPQSTTSKVMETIGDLYDKSKIAGLAPEVNPLMGAFNTSAAATMATSAPVRAVSNVVSKAGNVATAPVRAAGEILGETMSDFVKRAYQIGKYGDKTLSSAWRQGKAAGLPANEKGMSAIGNYIRAFFPESNPADIAKAKDMSKQAGGAWDVMKKAQEAEARIAKIDPRMNWSLPKDASLVLPQELQAAQQDLGWANAFRAGQEASWLPSGKTFVDVLKNPRTIPSIVSPRIQANIGYGTGAAQRYYGMLPQATNEDLYNLSLLAPRINWSE